MEIYLLGVIINLMLIAYISYKHNDIFKTLRDRVSQEVGIESSSELAYKVVIISVSLLTLTSWIFVLIVILGIIIIKFK